MEQCICTNCGYIYNPENGDPEQNIPPGVSFQDLPATWRCPICYVGKDKFDPY